MELQQIKYFKVIAETENISKAAEKLYIAQPSLSQTLKRLEDEIGTQLFDRNGKKITLNGAGKIFLKYCDDVIFALENAALELNEYIGSEISDVNIAVESASLLIPEIIERIQQHCPRIMPHIYQSSCPEWDLKIYSDYGTDGGNTSLILAEEPIGVVMPKEHLLAQKKKIKAADLQGRDFISLSPTCNLYKIISHFCENSSFAPNISMYVDSPSIMRDLLKMNLGVAFVPRYTWHSFYNDVLEFRTVSDMPMSRVVRLAVNDKKFTTTSVKSCRDTVAEFFKEYTQKFQ